MFKGWSQEETAEKLGIVLSGYSKIEHGETDISYSRLEQLANLFGIEISDLVGLNEKNVFNIMASCNEHSLLLNVSISASEAELKEQRLMNELKDKELAMQQREITLLEQKIADQQKIISFLENKPA
jgi:transcriptional regulator with XRE-family HTH domain